MSTPLSQDVIAAAMGHLGANASADSVSLVSNALGAAVVAISGETLTEEAAGALMTSAVNVGMGLIPGDVAPMFREAAKLALQAGIAAWYRANAPESVLIEADAGAELEVTVR